jgi:hypothetical protein
MRLPIAAGGALLGLMFIMGTLSAEAGTDEEGSIVLKEGAGRDLTTGMCTVCHSLDYIPSNAPAMDRGAWKKTVQKMRERYGAPITDAQAETILEYLSASYSGKN